MASGLTLRRRLGEAVAFESRSVNGQRNLLVGMPGTIMAVAAVTIHLPDAPWHAVQLLAPHGGDPNAVILRTLEEYVTATQKRGRQRTGKCQKLVQSLGMPRADLHLSARPAAAPQTLNIRYVYERVQKSPLDLVASPNVGQKSMKEIKEALATLGLR